MEVALAVAAEIRWEELTKPPGWRRERGGLSGKPKATGFHQVVPERVPPDSIPTLKGLGFSKRKRSAPTLMPRPSRGCGAPCFSQFCVHDARRINNAAPTFTAVAVPSASVISSRVALALMAIAVCTTIQPSHRTVTATASGLSSFIWTKKRFTEARRSRLNARALIRPAVARLFERVEKSHC